ncbi:MAG: efflux RND transporter permease subunit [Candidatus Gracilibacteria bacterium]
MDIIDQQNLEKGRKSIWTFFIRKKLIAFILIIGISIIGLLSIFSIPKESMPEVKIPMAVIMTALPGATPSDVEELVTKPVEKEIAGVSNIAEWASSSTFGVSVISVQFEPKVDTKEAIANLKDATDQAASDLPDSAIGPNVKEISFTDYPIITFALVGELSQLSLSQIADNVATELDTVQGVLKTEISGKVTSQVSVTLDQNKLENAGLSITDIETAIKYSNMDMPAGTINMDKMTYSVRFQGRIENLQDLGKIILTQGITLEDIAKIEFKTDKQSTLSRIWQPGQTGQSPALANGPASGPSPNWTKNAISISIYKKTGGNILNVVDLSKEKIDELKAKNIIPANIDVVVASDNASYIRKDLGNLTEAGIETFIIIIIVLFLAIGFKEGLIASLSVPLTLFVTIPILIYLGETLNSLTLFSMVIALGILVDTAIVMMEAYNINIAKGFNSTDAATVAIETYKWPLITSILTTTFAFVPMLMLSGIVGQFIRTLPITITIVLISSLLLSIVLIPAVAISFIKSAGHAREEAPKSILQPVIEAIKRFQINHLRSLMESRLKRIVLIGGTLFLFVLSISLPISGALQTEMFSSVDIPYFIISIETPKGTVLEETSKLASKVERLLTEVPEIDNFVTIVGSAQGSALTHESMFGIGGNLDSNLANITVNLVDEKNRERRSYEIADAVRNQIKSTILEGKITVTEMKEGPPSGAAVTINVNGDDMATLKKISKDIQGFLKEIKGTKNIDDSLTQGLNEFVFKLDRDRLALHSLSTIEVSNIIRSVIQGANATTITLDSKDTDVILKYDNTSPTISDIENIKIPSHKGYMIELKELGTYTFQESLSAINHREQKRSVQVTSAVEQDANSIEITQEIQNKLKDYPLPKGYTIDYSGDFESLTGSFSELGMAMLIGVILIAMTLILEFNSIRQTLIILFTVPMGLIGAIPGLWLFGQNFSFSAFLGIVALSGIVVSKGIVKIDKINSNLHQGNMPLKEAILEASASRTRPILLTTVATIIGAIPVALTDEFWRGIGVALATGVLASAFLALFVIPILYFILEKKKYADRL